jgi:hypothetical protein
MVLVSYVCIYDFLQHCLHYVSYFLAWKLFCTVEHVSTKHRTLTQTPLLSTVTFPLS